MGCGASKTTGEGQAAARSGAPAVPAAAESAAESAAAATEREESDDRYDEAGDKEQQVDESELVEAADEATADEPKGPNLNTDKVYLVQCPHCQTDKQRCTALQDGQTVTCSEAKCAKDFVFVACANALCAGKKTFKDPEAYAHGDLVACPECKVDFNKLRCPQPGCNKACAWRGPKAKKEGVRGPARCLACKKVMHVDEGRCRRDDQCRVRCVHCHDVSEFERPKATLQGQLMQCRAEQCGATFKFVTCPYPDCKQDTFWDNPDNYYAGARIVCAHCERAFNKVVCPYKKCGGMGLGVNVYHGDKAADRIEGPVTCAKCKKGYKVEEGGEVPRGECRIRCCHCLKVCHFDKSRIYMEGCSLQCTYADCGKAFKMVVCPQAGECGKTIWFPDVNAYGHGRIAQCPYCKCRFNKIMCPWHNCHNAQVWLNTHSDLRGQGQDGRALTCVACLKEYKLHVADNTVVRCKPRTHHGGGGGGDDGSSRSKSNKSSSSPRGAKKIKAQIIPHGVVAVKGVL